MSAYNLGGNKTESDMEHILNLYEIEVRIKKFKNLLLRDLSKKKINKVLRDAKMALDATAVHQLPLCS